MGIHPTAVVSPKARIGENVDIGPYCTIGPQASIGRDTVIGSHVVIEGRTELGERNRVYPFAVLGMPPQDIGYRGEDSRVRIGNDNIIREYVTIHRASAKEDWQTVVGDRNYLMAYAHVAHDCVLGNDIILSNVATLGGHTRVDDHANLGGLVAVHQFVRIGTHAFVGGGSGLPQDAPPFLIASGSRARLYGVNQKGLARKGITRETIDGLKLAYRILWRENRRLSDGIAQVEASISPFPELRVLLDFIKESKRGVLRA